VTYRITRCFSSFVFWPGRFKDGIDKYGRKEKNIKS
jgi:hypothetical protein